VFGGDALSQPRAGEAPFGPFPLAITVQGVNLNLRRAFFISRNDAPSGSSVHIRVVVDLSDVQAKVANLIASVPLPTDNCKQDGINLVVGISKVTLAAGTSEATLTLEGKVDPWWCTHVFGNEAKGELGPEQLVTVTVPVRLGTPTPSVIAVSLGPPHVELGGSLGQAEDAALHFFNVDLDNLVQGKVDSVINPALLQWSLPPATALAQLSFTGAGLSADDGGGLLASIDVRGALSLDQLLQGLPPPAE
jgi:hypothetical protein